MIFHTVRALRKTLNITSVLITKCFAVRSVPRQCIRRWIAMSLIFAIWIPKT